MKDGDLGRRLRVLDAGGNVPSVPRRSRKDDDPRILRRIAVTGELPRMTTEAWGALMAFNQPPKLFTVADRPARIKVGRTSGATTPEDLTLDTLTHYSARSAFWYKQNAGQHGLPGVEIEQPPPAVVMHDMLADPEPPLPPLDRITRAPAFGANGHLSIVPGYDPGTRHYFAAGNLAIPPVPDNPSTADCDAALDLLLNELLGDFPFAGPLDGASEAAHALSMILNPFVRDMIDGPTPMYLIEAPAAGAGKGLLAHVATLPALGEPPVLMPDARNEEELRKRLMSTLMALPEAVVLDNVAESLDSPSLAAALTSRTFTDRVLGRSEIRTVPVACTWIATGNNPSKSGEMARRTVRIRLDPQVERPEERQGFRHPDLERWARDHRGELVHACLVLVKSWIAAGMPPGSYVLGSFGDWARVHGGIIDHLGIKGFLVNRTEDRLITVSEDAAWSNLVDRWWATHRDRPVRVADLFDIALEIDGFPLGTSPSPRGQRNALGQALSRNRNRIFGARSITYAGTNQNTATYRLVSVEPDF